MNQIQNKNGRPIGATRKRTKDRDAQMWELAVQGKTQTEIARQLHVSQPVVNKNLTRLFNAHHTMMTNQVEAEVGILIAQYEYIIAENFQAWRNSKSPNNRVSKTNMRRLKADKQSSGDSNAGDLESTSVASSDVEPDTRYFETAMKAMKELRGLISVPTPQQVQLTGADGGPIRIQNELDFSGFGTAQMAAYLQETAKVAMSMGEQAIKSLPDAGTSSDDE